MKNPQMKVGRVMREFKKGELKSSSGQKVTNPKQAIAIGLSEAGISKKAKGGEMKESKAMVKKEVSFMKKKGAPKSMLKHEMAEAGMKKGGNVKKMAMGGMGQRPIAPPIANPVSRPLAGPRGSGPRDGGPRNPGPMPLPRVRKMMAAGGLAAGHKSADGVARKGKTKAEQVKMAGGGKTKKYC